MNFRYVLTGSFKFWIGGGLNGMAATGVATGLFFVLYGGLPWEFVVGLTAQRPEWLLSGPARLGAIIIGLVLIIASLRWNMWSRRHRVVGELARQLLLATGSDLGGGLLNPWIGSDADLDQFESEVQDWCDTVKSIMANNPAYFSEADIIHFDKVGKAPKDSWGFVYHPTPTDSVHEYLLNMLNLKCERLRDVINWVQQRTR